MSLINITNLHCTSPDTPFTDPLEFNVEFECLAPLESEFSWAITYISNPENMTQDQVLDSFQMAAQ